MWIRATLSLVAALSGTEDDMLDPYQIDVLCSNWHPEPGRQHKCILCENPKNTAVDDEGYCEDCNSWTCLNCASSFTDYDEDGHCKGCREALNR